MLALGVGLTSAQTEKGNPETVKVRDDLKIQEQRLLNQFKEFEDQLHRLKRRLSTSKDPDDRAKADLLEKVIEKARDESIIIQFEQINSAIKDQKFTNIGEIKLLLEKTDKLALDLQELLALMREDPNYNRAREERAFYEKLLKQLEKAIRDQRDVQIRTDLGKADQKELKYAQEKVTKLTEDIAKAIESKSGEGGEAKNTKGESKPGEAKGEGKSGESKAGGKEGKAGEAKGKEGKGGEGKEGKEGDGKKGDAKGGEGKGAEGKEGKSKSGEGAEGAKGGAKDAKGGEGKGGSKGGAGKEGDKKEGSAKDGGEKGAVKEKQPAGEAKPGDKSDKEAKSGEAKGGEGKGGEAKESKGAESKGSPKEGSKGAESKGGSKGGESSGGKGESKKGGEGSESKSSSKSPPAGDKKDQPQIGKKQVEDAQGYEKSAEENITKKKNADASDDQGNAIKSLEEAKKKLEDLLRQVREEELERLLAALQARCEKMLAMQIRVRNETVDISKVLLTHADKQPDREDKIRSLKQAKEEQDIVLEATKAIQMLEAEGTAVAFPEVFQQVREDMKIVQRRLEVTDVGTVTQAIEEDIIATLREMVDALKKARQENKDKKSDSKPGESKSGPQDQKLLDQIAELKMIRSMQIRVNNRTTTYGRLYVDREGEQARDPNIRRELRNLSERQERITEVTGRIAKGDNR